MSNERLVKLRTYKDDAARARGGAPEPVDTPPPKPAAPIPKQKPLPQPETPSSPTVPPSTPVRATSATPPAAVPHRAKPLPQPYVAPKAKPPTPKQSVSHLTKTISSDIGKMQSPRQSILSDDTDSLSSLAAPDIETAGTIVTDTKRKRFRLFPAMFAALKEWLFEKREDFEESRKPQHTVAPAQSRSEVIQQAAGALAPRDDYSVVRERLRHVPRTHTTGADVSIRKASEVPEPQWSHTGDEPEAPVATPEPKPVVQPPAPAPVQEAAPKSAPEPKPLPEPEPKPEPVKPAPETAVPTRPATPATVSRTTPPTAPRRRSYILIAAIGGCAAVLGIVTTVWFFDGPDTDSPAVVLTETGTSFIDASVKQPVSLGRTQAELMSALNTAHTTTGADASIVEYYPTVPDGERRVPATTADIVTVFAPEAPGSFTRSITAIGFGAYRGSPYLVLKVSSFDTALGGILAWEPALTQDLAPFFGIADTELRPFVDTVHANRDIRVRTRPGGADHIVYTFVNRTTILISTDRMVIEDLAPLIR